VSDIEDIRPRLELAKRREKVNRKVTKSITKKSGVAAKVLGSTK